MGQVIEFPKLDNQVKGSTTGLSAEVLQFPVSKRFIESGRHLAEFIAPYNFGIKLEVLNSLAALMNRPPKEEMERPSNLKMEQILIKLREATKNDVDMNPDYYLALLLLLIELKSEAASKVNL